MKNYSLKNAHSIALTAIIGASIFFTTSKIDVLKFAPANPYIAQAINTVLMRPLTQIYVTSSPFVNAGEIDAESNPSRKFSPEELFSEVIGSAMPYKLGIEMCVVQYGSLNKCVAGKYGINNNFISKDDSGVVSSVIVKSNGVIVATAKNKDGLSGQQIILTPEMSQDNLITWKTSGSCVQQNLC